MWNGLCSLLKAVRGPIVVYFCVIWPLVNSYLIGNPTTSSFLVIIGFKLAVSNCEYFQICILKMGKEKYNFGKDSYNVNNER